MIKELLKEKNAFRKEVEEAFQRGIENGLKAMKETKEPEVVIYEADLNNDKPIEGRKMYYEPSFSGCGWAYLILDRKTAKKLKKAFRKVKDEKSVWELNIGKYDILLQKGNIYNILIKGFTYSNGHLKCLERFYQEIEKELQKFIEDGFIFTETRLD